MSKTDLYYEVLEEITCHAILHLYLKIQNKKGFTPRNERNNILIKYLKDKLLLSKFKPCKKEIKMMLLLAKKDGDLLAKLNDINQMIINC